MTSISPLLQAKIAQQQNTTQSPIETPKIDLTQKPDSVEINSGTNKKKVAKYIGIGIGIGIALACTIATTAFLLTKGKTCLLEFNAKKAQKYAEDIKEKAEKLKNEVIELFNTDGMKNGNKVANIADDVDCKIMEEIDSSGTLIRKSIFNLDGTLSKIELPTKKGADLYSFDHGKLFDYAKNFQQDSEGNISAAKRLYFENGKLTDYVKNFQRDSKGNESTAKKLYFKDGELTAYEKNIRIEENESIAKRLYFENGKLAIYTKNLQEDSKGNKSEAKILGFKDGKLAAYVKNFQQDSEKNTSAAKVLRFENGKLALYTKNFQADLEGNASAVKMIEFTPGKPLKNLMIFLKSFFKKD